MRIAVLGGTGPEGRGIAARLAAVGESVVIGSRSPDRATEAAQELREQVPAGDLSGAANREAAASAEMIFVAVPYEGVDAILDAAGEAFAGRIVVDTVVPLVMERGSFRLQSVPEGSVAERIVARVPGARVVSAFKHQSAHDLLAVDRPMEGDVLACSNDREALKEVAALVTRIRDLRPIDAGDLANARILEAMTALLLNLNRRHKTRTSVRILGI